MRMASQTWHLLSFPEAEGCAKCRQEARSQSSALVAPHPVVTETRGINNDFEMDVLLFRFEDFHSFKRA